MRTQRTALTLFWFGRAIAVAFAAIGTWALMQNLRTLTMEQLDATVWALDSPLFRLWAFSVPLGAILAAIGAFVYVRTRAVFSWITAVGVLGAVVAMVMLWSRVYSAPLFGIGGGIILISFFAIVWIWMKQNAGLGIREKAAASIKLIGYIFWIDASWFLCGETGNPHLKAFQGAPPPVPIEIMVFLALGWVCLAVGHYQELRLRKSQ
jgi:hypothetical protein